MVEKEMLWREINSLPESKLESLWQFVQFLQYTAEEEAPSPEPTTRVAGLDVGTVWMSDDFDEPLLD